MSSQLRQPGEPTHYQVLDVARTAGQVEVRQAYHRAARRWHPDRFVSEAPAAAERAEAEMRRVNLAWEVLGDPARRRIYDLELRQGISRSPGSAGAGAQTGVGPDGVVRIDPRLLDPTYLAARRHAQANEIADRSSLILRAAPLVVVLALLGAIFVFTAYARDNPDPTTETTAPGPNLGAGIEANDCVTVIEGPALLERDCGPGAAGRVIGARLPDGECPVGAVREVELINGAIVCLAPAG